MGALCVSIMFISLLAVVMEAQGQLGDPALHGTGLLTLMHGKWNVLSGSHIFNPKEFETKGQSPLRRFSSQGGVSFLKNKLASP